MKKNVNRMEAMSLYERESKADRTVGMEHASYQGAQPVVPGCNVKLTESMNEAKFCLHSYNFRLRKEPVLMKMNNAEGIR